MDDGNILNSVYNYIGERKQFIYTKTKLGDLVANEDEFRLGYTGINWSNKSIASDKQYNYISSARGVRQRLADLLQVEEPVHNQLWYHNEGPIFIDNNEDNEDNEDLEWENDDE